MNYFICLGILIAVPPAWAGLCPVQIAQRAGHVGAGSSEISVEWTLSADTLKPYLVPENGRVGGLLPQIRTPQWLEEWWASPQSASARRQYPRVGRVRELPWKAFPIGLHDKLISHAARQSAQLPEGQTVNFQQAETLFFGDRSLGLERVALKGKVPVLAKSDGNLFGQSVRQGEIHPVDLEKLSTPSSFDFFTVLRNTQILEPIDTLVDGKISDGTHDLLAVGSARNGAVEHGNASSLEDVLAGIPASSYQIHLRSQPGEMLASQMLDGVNALAAHFGHDRPTLHMHIVEQAPLERLWTGLPTARVGQALSMVDFVLRANDLEEQRSVMEGNTIRLLRTTENHCSIWAIFESQHLAKLVDRFMDLMLFESYNPDALNFPYLGDEFKGAFVGVHWSVHRPEKYDRQGVWGLHVRGIDRVSSGSTHAAIVDSFQKRMVTSDYVQPFQRIWKWLDLPISLERGIYQQEISQIGEKFALARWNKPWDVLFEQIDPILAPLVDAGMREYLKALTEFRALADANYEAAPHFEVKQLLHNYGSQLNYFDDPVALERIRQSQKAGLVALREVAMKRSTANPTDIVRTFLRDSGVWERSLDEFDLTAN